MAKSNLASMSVDALLKLRDDVGTALSRRTDELKKELSRLGGEIGHTPHLKGERCLSSTVTGRATLGPEEERSPSGCERN